MVKGPIQLPEQSQAAVRAAKAGERVCPFFSLADGSRMVCIETECPMWTREPSGGCVVVHAS